MDLFLRSKTPSAPLLLILSTKACECQLHCVCWGRVWTFHKALWTKWPHRVSQEYYKRLMKNCCRWKCNFSFGGESEITLSSLVTYTPTNPLYWVSLGFVCRAAFIPHNQFNKVLKHSSQISFHIRTFHIRLTTPEFSEVFAVGADFKVFSLCRN